MKIANSLRVLALFLGLAACGGSAPLAPCSRWR